MKKATVYRRSDDGVRCFGRMACTDGPSLHSMERPWLSNRTGVSCIRTGVIPFRWRASQRFGHAYRADAEAVAPRTAILVHPASLVHNLRGCISLGRRIDKTGDLLGEPGLLESKLAVEDFEDWAQGLLVMVTILPPWEYQ